MPANHPANPYGEDVFFQGRPYGYGQPREVNFYEHDTARLAFGLDGRFSDAGSWNISIVHGINDALLNPRDVIAANFQAALSGFGGNACNTGAATPQEGGRGNCLFFNPFSSNFSAQPGEPLHNAPELRDFIIGDYFGDGRSQLTALEANLTGFLPWRSAGYAAGVQYRDQSLEFAYDDITRSDGFAFLIGNSDFTAHDDVTAAYGEIWVPLTENLEMTGALRYEDYGGGVGDTLDPKVTLLFRANETISIRGSAGTSFRAPSPFQTLGVQTNFTNIVDHDGSTTFAGRRTLGDPDLSPETSRAFNFGLTWRNAGYWAFNADYWRYSFEDVLRKENAQSIVNVAFINADRIETSGLDVSANATLDTRSGSIDAWVEATWLLEYDVTNAGVAIDALGKLNRANVGAPNQRCRAAAGASWSTDAVRITGLLRHVGGYQDDAGGSIDRFTTLDVNARWSLGGRLGDRLDASVTVGAANLLDEDPPFVNIAGSYDPRSADPRGHRVFVSFGLER